MASHGPRYISASDVERYAYCPMNYWLKRSGAPEKKDILQKGEEAHRKMGRELSDLKSEEDQLPEATINLWMFIFVSVILALTGLVLVLIRTASDKAIDILGNFLLLLAALWLVISVLFFVRALRMDRLIKATKTLEATRVRSKPEMDERNRTRRGMLLRLTVWVSIFAVALGGIWFAYSLDMDPDHLSTILLLSGLLWMIGTFLVLFGVIRKKGEDLPNILEIPLKGRLFTEDRALIIGFALISTVLVVSGLLVSQRNSLEDHVLLGDIILYLAALWMGISFLFTYLSFREGIVHEVLDREINHQLKDIKRELPADEIEMLLGNQLEEMERGALWFAVIAAILGYNSVLVRFGFHDVIGQIIEIVAFIWLAGATVMLFMMLRGSKMVNNLRNMHKIPDSQQVRYADRVEEDDDLLVSKKYRLRGRPDLVLEEEGSYIPVEIKTGKVPQTPHFSHIMQLVVYMALVEEAYGKRPKYGIVRYAGRNGSDPLDHRINFTDKLEGLLRETLNDMRKLDREKTAHRNHDRPGKCRFCSRRRKCPERLA